MGELLAMSFDQLVSPAITVLERPLGNRAVVREPVWGIGWYPGGELAGDTIKNLVSKENHAVSEVISDRNHFRSTLFVGHIRVDAKRLQHKNTNPFIRSWGGRSWLFAHDGALAPNFAELLPLGPNPTYEPLGRTDTEHLFCWLLTLFQQQGVRRLRDFSWEHLYGICSQLNQYGTMNILLSDGEDLLVYHDQSAHRSLCWQRGVPPNGFQALGHDALAMQFFNDRDPNRTGIVFSSRPLSSGEWIRMSPGQLLVAGRGSVVWDSAAIWDGRKPESSRVGMLWTGPGGALAPFPDGSLPLPQRFPVTTFPGDAAPAAESTRILSVHHQSIYRYSTPVESSGHVFRLKPLHDRRQSVLSHRLKISVDGGHREFEDVFGNLAVLYTIEEPYAELKVSSQAVVELTGEFFMDPGLEPMHEKLPLVWMPWQRQMMLPYLLPPELPESELRELNDFAMSFVARNDHDLIETLLDMNRTIQKDFSYVSGSTTLETTPYEVYVQRRGVCQDFANLLICMARLLNVPARYRAGYIHTGADHPLALQSEATHAWAELYLPYVGWIGFDPTNGVIADMDHIRVACGRNYSDATPTAGTLYKGGGGETLDITVKVSTDANLSTAWPEPEDDAATDTATTPPAVVSGD